MTDGAWAALSIGAITAGTREAEYWANSIGTLMRQVKLVRPEADPVMEVNLVYFVFGAEEQDFDGVRTGSFLRRDRVQIIQANVEPLPEGVGVLDVSLEWRRSVLLGLMWDAVELAESHLRKRKVVDGLPELRRVVGVLEGMPVTDGREKTPAELDVDPPYMALVEEWKREKALREREASGD
jgi:hypothetical protein